MPTLSLFRLFILLCLVTLQLPVKAEQPATEKSVKELMQLIGTANMSQQILVQMLPLLKDTLPEAPDEFWQRALNDIDPSEMEKRIIPIYQKYLSESDLQAINQFYQSSAGKKLIAVQPNISRESMIAGQLWAQSIARHVKAKYKAEQKTKEIERLTNRPTPEHDEDL